VDGWDASDAELEEAAVYVERRPEVREVLVSGGDPLVLETPRISRILDRFSRIPSIKIIRVGSRVPVALPMRVDAELAEALAAVPGLWLATHFNHPAELTEASRNACRTLVSKGVPVLNQTVLLKGVNDDPDTLVELFSELASERVKPHYLFHVDPAPGCADFATGVERALEIVRALRNGLSSVATPTFAIDLPGGGGKVPLLPDYRREDGTFEALAGGGIEYPFK
jgi:lysine 2,3-aminomutase